MNRKTNFLTNYHPTMRQKLTLLSLLLTCLFTKSFAQLPDGSVAPDWTMTDLNGQSWHLYDLLDAGKPVFLDFSATWCGPCWNYHNTHALRNLYDTYGPPGTDQLMVFFIEADNATNLACLYGPSGCVGGTQGNWVNGTTYPIINDASSNSDYQIAYFPTIYKICPNRIITEVGQVPTATLWAEAQECSEVLYQQETQSVACFGGNNGSINLTVTSGLPPFSFNWSNGAHTEDISNLTQGTYKCTITGQFGGIRVTNNIIVGQPTAAVNVNVTASIPQHCGDVNGQITVAANGGTPGYSYEWDNGNTGPVNPNLSAGTYIVTVTDNHGCIKTKSATISSIAAPIAVASVNGDITCISPTQVVSGSGSTSGPGITYKWTTPNGVILSGGNTLNATVGTEGDYFLEVKTSQYNCSDETSVYVASYITPPNSDAGPDGALTCTVNQVSLNGSASSNGIEYNLLWTTTNGHIASGANTLTPVVDAPGAYVLRITNIYNGCLDRDTSMVILNSSMTVSTSQQNPACNGANNGNATVIVSGGAGVLEYLWSNNGTTNSISNVGPGNYTVTITDEADCTTLSSFTLTEPTSLAANATSTNVSAPNVPDGTATAVPTGGVGPYTYLWSNGETTATITGLLPGAYSVTITDANNCTTMQTVGVSAPGCALLAQVIQQTNATCYGEANGAATINANGGTGSLLITWPNGQLGATQSGLLAGTYQVAVLDENGCPATVDVVITQPTQISATTTNLVNVICPSDQNGAISIAAAGGVGAPYTYAWSNGSTNQAAQGLSAGPVSVIITDGNGCHNELQFNIQSTDTEKPTLVALAVTTISLDANGQAQLTPEAVDLGSTDNCAIASRTFSNSSFNCDDLGQKIVLYTVTDANGNKETAQILVNIVDQLAPVVTCPAPIIVYSCDKPVIYTINATDNCTPSLNLVLKSGLPSGSYFPNGTTTVSYLAKDAAGNEGQCAFTVTVNSKVLCNGKVDIGKSEGPWGGGQDPNPLIKQGSNKVKGTASLYPNPANEQLTINLENWNALETQIDIIDMQGKRHMSITGFEKGQTTKSISTANLPAGLYLVRISADGNRLTEKVSIQH
ncbi:MAG: T9SS type A sorting domain-containing protein [Saprospiraceae bacterium]